MHLKPLRASWLSFNLNPTFNVLWLPTQGGTRFSRIKWWFKPLQQEVVSRKHGTRKHYISIRTLLFRLFDSQYQPVFSSFFPNSFRWDLNHQPQRFHFYRLRDSPCLHDVGAYISIKKLGNVFYFLEKYLYKIIVRWALGRLLRHPTKNKIFIHQDKFFEP